MTSTAPKSSVKTHSSSPSPTEKMGKGARLFGSGLKEAAGNNAKKAATGLVNIGNSADRALQKGADKAIKKSGAPEALAAAEKRGDKAAEAVIGGIQASKSAAAGKLGDVNETRSEMATNSAARQKARMENAVVVREARDERAEARQEALAATTDAAVASVKSELANINSGLESGVADYNARQSEAAIDALKTPGKLVKKYIEWSND